MHDLWQRVFCKHLEDNMNMIRHHAPSKQLVLHSIEVAQCICYDLGHGLICQKASPGTGIKIFLNPLGLRFLKTLPFRF